MAFDPISLAVWGATTLLQMSLTARMNRLSLKDFQVPEAEVAPLPLPYGTVKIPAYLIWYGDFRRSSVRTEIPGWINWLAPVTALIDQLPFGYRYYLGLTFALCKGRGDAVVDNSIDSVKLTGVYANDKLVWTGDVADASFTVAAPGAFGRQGGVYANCEFSSGKANATRNTYFSTQVTDPPAFRNTAVVYWHGGSDVDPLGKIKYSGYVGRDGYLKDFRFRVRHITQQIFPSHGTIDTDHANPVQVIWDLLTDTDHGLGISINDGAGTWVNSMIDVFDEGIGCSFAVFDGRTTVQDAVEGLLDLIDALVYMSPVTGELEIKLIREETPAVTLDESNIAEVMSYAAPDLIEAPSEIRVEFTNNADNFKEDVAIWQSTGLRVQASTPNNSVTLRPFGCAQASVASEYAARMGRAYAFPFKRVDLKLTRLASQLGGSGQPSSLLPGSTFYWNWSEYGITGAVYRVIAVEHGTPTDPSIIVHAVQDRFGITSPTFGVVTTSDWTDPIPETPTGGGTSGIFMEVLSNSTSSPPGAPATGDAYIVPAGATGAWSGHDNDLAVWNGTAWEYTEGDDLEMLVVYVIDLDEYWYYSNGVWAEFTLEGGINPGELSGLWSPLTNETPADPQLVFDVQGDVIMVFEET